MIRTRPLRLDPELSSALSMASVPDLYDLAAVRDWNRMAIGRTNPDEYPTVAFEDVTITGPQGSSLRIRLYRPKAQTEAAPVLLWLHGGAFSHGVPEIDDEMCAGLVAETACVVVSPDYRLAPEHPYPAALDDAYAALHWIDAEADALRFRRDRIVVGGASAGGCLAAAVSLLSRDRGGPSIVQQLLVYPVLDDRLTTPSMQEFVDSPVLDRGQATVMWRRYLPNGTGKVSPYAAPARCKDLRGLPPAYVLTLEIDPLRDEGIAYAMRLLEAGVQVELRLLPGAYHGFEPLAPSSPLAQRVFADYVAVLRRAMAD